ncbi:hypothetical protein [Ketobacter sp.]|uniref:hypothetical protein n=1 Tax=Ketobacter sp. TaxID=2083498 RepID=UPI0025C16574|nr:hypothetical protein [Ketobacter sp.]
MKKMTFLGVALFFCCSYVLSATLIESSRYIHPYPDPLFFVKNFSWHSDVHARREGIGKQDIYYFKLKHNSGSSWAYYSATEGYEVYVDASQSRSGTENKLYCRWIVKRKSFVNVKSWGYDPDGKWKILTTKNMLIRDSILFNPSIRGGRYGSCGEFTSQINSDRTKGIERAINSSVVTYKDLVSEIQAYDSDLDLARWDGSEL